MVLKNMLENSFNHERLKKIRLKRKMSFAEVSQKTGIPEATLHRYENGITKKIPLESLKKLASLYDVDYRYLYSWTSLPLFGSITGMILSSIYGFDMFNITGVGFILGVTGLKTLTKYFEKVKTDSPKKSLYEQLTEEEKEEYETYKAMTYSFLRTKKTFSADEIEEDEAFLFAYFFAHKVRRENNIREVQEIKE